MRALFGGDLMLRSVSGLARINSTTLTLTFWDAETGGSQVTDLLAADASTPITDVTVSGGTLPAFYGPDDVVALWADTGDASRELIRGSLEPAGLSTSFVRGRTYSANDEGADPAADAETNRAAFQAANDKAAAAGGGRVVADPGTYTVQGIVQDSRVHFYLPDVTLSHPDGSTGDIITARIVTQGAQVDANLTSVYVTDSSEFEVGQIVGIRAAGVVNPTQNTTLTGAIDATQTTGITLAATTGFPSSGAMLVGSEVITYTGLSGGSLTGVTRGAYGTTAAAHTSGAIIGQVLGHLSTVESIVSATTITITTPAERPVTGTTISGGIVSPKITGASLHVNRAVDGLAWSYGVSWPLVRWGELDAVYVQDGDGGVILDQGASDCSIRDLHLHNCGLPEISGGSSFWLFRSCKRNKINGLTVTGEAWVAAYVDDRTTTGTEWDGPNEDNIFTDLRVDISQPGTGTAAVYAVGSNRNYFGGGYVKGSPVVGTGLSVSQGSQGVTHDGSKAPAAGNEFASFRLVNCRTPWNLSAAGNWLHDVTHEGAVGNPMNDGGNFIYAVKAAVSSPGLSMGGRLEKKGYLDFPSIPAGSTAELTMTVTGARVGDLATAHPNALPPAGLMWGAVVTATDTVTVRLANVTAAPIDPPNYTWRVSVMGGTT